MVLLVGGIPASAGATGRDKDRVDGNPKCADLGYANGFKIQGGEVPAAGTYGAGDAGVETEGNAAGFEVTISYASTDPIDLGFEANTAVDAVLVKAGPGGFLYSYDPPVSSDSGLGSPKDSISHISFCWDGETPPPDDTTPTTEPGDEPGDEPGPDDEAPSGQAPPATPVNTEPNFTG